LIPRICLIAAALLAVATSACRSQGSLLYLEAQGIAGYSSAAREAIYYSMSPEEAMQKPSVGFDWLRRLSGETRDFGVVGVQARLAYNHKPDREAQLQLYNAWFKYKAGYTNIWIGHDRPAFGLSSYFDTHGLLLQSLAMMGWGFDRDWGVGFSRDVAWGNVSGSITTGSGMPLYFKGNHFASARVAKGVLEEENYTIGFSAGWGDVLETMGYELVSDQTYPFHMVSIDLAYLWTRWENRVELMAGERMDEPAYALYWRLGMNLLEENRLKLEVQPEVWKELGTSSFMLSAGVSYQATADLAIRSMYQYINTTEDNRIVFQVYYYKRW
jgi:opacity protein-like surface antigen